MRRYSIVDANGHRLDTAADYPTAVRRAVALGPGTRVHDVATGKLLWPLEHRAPSTPAPVDAYADTVPAPPDSMSDACHDGDEPQ